MIRVTRVSPLDVIRAESPGILAVDRDSLVLRNGRIGGGRIQNSTARVKEEFGPIPYCLYPYGFSSGVRTPRRAPIELLSAENETARQGGANFEDAESSIGSGLAAPRCYESDAPGATCSNIQALPGGCRVAYGSTYPFQPSAVYRRNGRDIDGHKEPISGTAPSTVTPVCDIPPSVFFDGIFGRISNLGKDAGFSERGVSRDLFTPEER